MTGDDLRSALRALASPVVVVVAHGPAGSRGATIGSFTSVSLEPPQVAFFVMYGTRFHEIVEAAEAVEVHLLGAGQADAAAAFAVRVPAGMPEPPQPEVDGALGVLSGVVAERIALADHTLVVVRVTAIVGGADGPPLVWHRQGYRTVGEIGAR